MSRVLKLWILTFVVFYSLFLFFVSVVVCLFVWLPGAVLVFVVVPRSVVCLFSYLFCVFFWIVLFSGG